MTRSKPPRRPVLAVLAIAVLGASIACGAVPDDPGARLVPPGGIIRGTVVYRGPRPCSRDGHIVGSAVVLVFDFDRPPPPDGFAATALNFATVTGDTLFGNEPRYTGKDTYCPLERGVGETIGASAPFEVAPIAAGGTYQIRALYDHTGHFLPEFDIRNLPEPGDVVGGDVDVVDATLPMNLGNPNYSPRFLPVHVGDPQSLSSGGVEYVIPPAGSVADNVTVTVAAPVSGPRPYFFAQGEAVVFDAATMGLTSSITQSSDSAASDGEGIEATMATDPNSMPILTFPQDIRVSAPPASVSAASMNFYEAGLRHIVLRWGLPAGELAQATATPFELPVAAFGEGPAGAGFQVWQNATLDAATLTYVPQLIPEGGEPQLWPVVLLTRLPDAGATGAQPLVVLQGITLLGGVGSDSLFGTALAARLGSLWQPTTGGPPRPVVFAQDHLVVVLRPSVLCLPAPPEPGTLVTPYSTATTADVDCSSGSCTPTGAAAPIVPPDLLDHPPLSSLASTSAMGCLPTGRYAIHVVYPDGQAWTVPNEAGVCAPNEGMADDAALTCTLERRPLLYSQGSRGVVEIVAATDPAYCVSNPVPRECLTSP